MLEQVYLTQALIANGTGSGLVLQIGPVEAAAACVIMLLCVVSIYLIYHGLMRRLQVVESRLDRHIRRQQGPTVRQFCRSLIESLKLRLPRSEVPNSAIREEDMLIRGLVYHLKRRHRKRLIHETRFRQLQSEMVELKKAIRATRRHVSLETEAAERLKNLVQESETQARRCEALLNKSRTLQPQLKEAVDVRQQLEQIQNQAMETCATLRTLHESLDQPLNKRRNLLNRIDSQLRERQIQLVTDILRAEGGHLKLSDLMNHVEETLTSLNDITDWSKLGRERTGLFQAPSAPHELTNAST